MTGYVCLEGIKGAGKSTLLTLLSLHLSLAGVRHARLSPFAKRPASLIDDLHALSGRVWPDAWTERMYAARAAWHWQQSSPRSGLLLGDRSLLTSYVTRFSATAPEVSMRRVERVERVLPLPDLLLWLDAPVSVALERIQSRFPLRGPETDALPGRLEEARAAYQAMLEDPARFGLERLKMVRIDASQPCEAVLAQCLPLIDERAARWMNARMQEEE